VIANVFPVNFELFLKISNIFDDWEDRKIFELFGFITGLFTVFGIGLNDILVGLMIEFIDKLYKNPALELNKYIWLAPILFMWVGEIRLKLLF
jgi:hypothetical protein